MNLKNVGSGVLWALINKGIPETLKCLQDVAELPDELKRNVNYVNHSSDSSVTLFLNCYTTFSTLLNFCKIKNTPNKFLSVPDFGGTPRLFRDKLTKPTGTDV